MSQQETLTRIAFLYNILSYISDSPTEFLSLRVVHTSWDDCIINYSENTWRRIYDNYRDDVGNTLLHISACKNAWMIKLFLNFDVNLGDSRSETALHWACWYGHTEIVKLLLESGANVDAINNYKSTSLSHACSHGYIECAKLLLENGANIETTDKKNWTPLHNACFFGRTECAKLLLDNGANIWALDNELDMTPLHRACEGGSIECARLLIEKGANVEALGKFALTPLHSMCRINSGVPICDAGWAARHAQIRGRIECIKLLLEKGANIEAPDARYYTPLYYASEYEKDCIECMKFLLENGANTEVFDRTYCQTPLHSACRDNRLESAKLLIAFGANMGATDTSNGAHVNDAYWTPLHSACLHDSIECVKLLIESGANVEAKDGNGQTPMDIALNHDRSKCIDFIQRWTDRKN